MALWKPRYLYHYGRRTSRTLIEPYSTRRHLQQQDQGYHYNISINPYTTQRSACDTQHTTHTDMQLLFEILPALTQVQKMQGNRSAIIFQK
jgi:hypothetical protein